MMLSYLVGGMPRGGTTVAAKFLSLGLESFCYAGETHLIPLLYDMFRDVPCRSDKINLVKQFLHQQFSTSMVEMPRYSVSQGAHPGNLIFDFEDVDFLVDGVGKLLQEELVGRPLFDGACELLGHTLSSKSKRAFLGEKTPSNIFPLAEYSDSSNIIGFYVIRDPLGVVKSMKSRVAGGDAFSGPFEGGIEKSLGLYLRYSKAIVVASEVTRSSLVRFEDMAAAPAAVLTSMFQSLGLAPEQRILDFVENGSDREIADRAPVNYRRLKINNDLSPLEELDYWKVLLLTRNVRNELGYTDEYLFEMGYPKQSDLPNYDVPYSLLTLYGVIESDAGRSRWLAKNSAVVLYLQKCSNVSMRMIGQSSFGGLIRDNFKLEVVVGSSRKSIFEVNTHGKFQIDWVIKSEEMTKFGNGAFVTIEFVSPISGCQLGHSRNGVDARECAIELFDFSVIKKGLFSDKKLVELK